MYDYFDVREFCELLDIPESSLRLNSTTRKIEIDKLEFYKLLDFVILIKHNAFMQLLCGIIGIVIGYLLSML